MIVLFDADTTIESGKNTGALEGVIAGSGLGCTTTLKIQSGVPFKWMQATNCACNSPIPNGGAGFFTTGANLTNFAGNFANRPICVPQVS